MPVDLPTDHAHVAGMVWATRVTSIASLMAVPPLLGFLADKQWGLAPWFTILGACIGFAMAMGEVFRLAKPPPKKPRHPPQETHSPDRDS